MTLEAAGQFHELQSKEMEAVEAEMDRNSKRCALGSFPFLYIPYTFLIHA
jgi:hypothetical protein